MRRSTELLIDAGNSHKADGIQVTMPVVTEFSSNIANLRVLARIVNAESDRLCAILDRATSFRVREQALLELKQLAENVAVLLEPMQLESAEPEEFEFEAAA